MGQIRHESSGQQVILEGDHLVGRSQRCTLRISDEHVSNEHASIRWNGERWVLKDLGSLNRTLVEGRSLTPSESVVLRVQDRIAFGSSAQTWSMVDDTPPGVTAAPEDGGLPVLATGGLLALPSPDDPSVVLHRDQHGAWVIEADGATRQVADQDWIEAAGRRFKLNVPTIFAQTAPLQGFLGRRVADLVITFRASRDLEHIEMLVGCGAKVEQLGARGHNEMLLVLARTRKQDIGQGIPPANCGWMYQDDLCRSVALDPSRLNVDVYRVRQVFAELGLLDPGHIIERRPRSRQLRIGTANLEEVIL